VIGFVHGNGVRNIFQPDRTGREDTVTKKERIVKKAKELKVEYKSYIGCSARTFASVVDAFRSEGIELFTPEVQEQIFKGLYALTGGTAAQSIGTCGSVVAGTFLVSYVSDLGTQDLTKGMAELTEEDKNKILLPIMNAMQGITDKFMQQYGSILCNEIRFKRTGRVYSFIRPDTFDEMVQYMKTHPEDCGSDDVTSDHPSTMGAGWAVEAICALKGIDG
jgi:hypothetical protein